MNEILKYFLVAAGLLGNCSVYAIEITDWKEEIPLKFGGHQLRYGSLNYGDICQNYSNIGVVFLHGSAPKSTSDTKGAFDLIAQTISVPGRHLQHLAEWLESNCARIVVPDSGLKYSLEQRTVDYKRWDSDNALGGFERKLIIQLMDKMVREQGITELYILGHSSGSMMTHNVAQELINHPYGANEQVRNALKGIVMADGISANQVHYLDSGYKSS